MKTIRIPHALLAALLCSLAAGSPASEQSRARNMKLLELGGVIQGAASAAGQRDDPARYLGILGSGGIDGAIRGCAGGAMEAAARGARRGADIRRACKDSAASEAVDTMIDAHDVALQEEANQRRISMLRAATEHVQRENQQIQALVDTSTQSLRDGQARLAALQRDVAARRVTATQAEQARAREQQNVDAMRTTIENLKATREQHGATSLRATGSATERRQLDAEIARMDRQIRTLEGQLADYQRALKVSGA
ncbi:MAG: hypothetical protein KF788_05695 [Piscinibacter sp.]|nr:hypothetical protein [Piscinibacter sp.]